MPKNIFSFFSKQKPSAAVLKNLSQEMLAFLEKLPTAVLLVGQTGKIGLANPAAVALLHQEANELVGTNIQQLGMTIAQLKELQGDADGTKRLLQLTDLKGNTLQVSAGAKKLGDTSFTTLTLEKVSVEEQMRQQYVLFKRVLDSYPGAVTVQDANGRCLFWNEQAHQFFGSSFDQVQGKIIYQVLPKSISALIYGLDEELKASQTRLEPTRISYQTPDKQERMLSVWKKEVPGDAPEERLIVTLYEDATSRLLHEQDLERSQKLLQAILENIPLGLYTRDCDEKITFFNRQSMKVLNESSAYRTDHPNEHQSDSHIQEYAAREKQILKEGKTCEYPEEVYVDSSGNKKIIHMIKVPLLDAGSKPLVLTIVEDITKRHEQEEEIRRVNGFLSAIVQNAPIALYARAEDGRLLLRNKRCAEIFGTEEEEPIDERGGFSHETNEQVSSYMAREHEILLKGESVDIPEEEYITAKGEKRLLHLVKAPVQEGRCVITLVEDITSKKAQERALVESKNFLQTVINQLPVSLSVKNYEGEYILWNKKSEELFGAAANEVIGHSAYRADLNKEQSEFVRETDLRVFESKKEQNIAQELISSPKDGIKIMHTVKTPVFNEDGTPNCLLIVSEDITTKTKMEKQIREASDKNTLLVENAREGVVMIEDGKIIYANRAFCDMLGAADLDELKGKDLLGFSTENHRVFLKEKYEAVRSGADSSQSAIEAHFLRKDGTKLEAKFAAVLAKYLGRRIVLGFASDITAENRTLRELKNDRDNFRRAFEQSVLPAFILSPRGYISLMNKSCRSLLGFTESDKKFYCNVYVRPGIALSVRKAMKEGKSAQLDYTLDFDKMAQKFPGRIEKQGTLNLSVSFVPLSKRDAKDGSVEAEYMVSLQPKEVPAVVQIPPAAPAPTPAPDPDPVASPEVPQFSKTAAAADSLPPLPPFLVAKQHGEEKKQMVLPNSEPYCLCDENFVIQQCNELFCSLCGLQSDELARQDIRHLFHQDEQPLVRQDFQLLQKEGKLSNREYTINLGSGLETCKVRLMAVREEETRGFLFVMHSLAFHTQIMKILEERSAQLNALRSATEGAVLRIGFSQGKLGQLEQLNNWLSKRTGYLHEELAQKSFAELFVEEDPDQPSVPFAVSKAEKQLLKTGKVSFILPMRDKGGTVFQAQVVLSVMDIPDRQDVLGVITDLTAQQNSLGKVSTQAQELASLLQTLPGLYLRVDEEGTVLEVSSNLSGLDNVQAKEMFLGKKPEDFWPQEAAAQALFTIKEALAVHVSSNFEFEWPRQNQSHYYEVDITPLENTRQAVVWVKDATEKRGYNSHLRELYNVFKRTDLDMTELLDKMLVLGNLFFQTQVGMVLRFQQRKARLESVVIYASENPCSIERHMEFPVEECLQDVADGSAVLLPDLDGLSCKHCIHRERKLGSLLAVPLVVAGKVEGALCFASSQRKSQFGVGAEELLGLMGRLLGMRIELRQAGKMLGAAARMFTRTLDDVQLPALRIAPDFSITYVNNAFLNWTGRKRGNLLGRDLFKELSRHEDTARRALEDLLQKSSGFDACQVKLDILLPGGLYQETAWDVFLCKNAEGQEDGYVLVSQPGN